MKTVVITSGYFNPMHSGHVNLLRESKSLGDFLVVIVNNDQQAKAKGSTQFMQEEERVEIVQAVKYVDEVFLSIDTDKSIAKSLEAIAQKFAGDKIIFAKGGDRNAGNIPDEETQVCQQYGIEIVNGVGGGKVQSSSWLLNRIINHFFSIKIMEKMGNIPSMEVLGNKIDLVQIPDVIELMDFWIQQERETTHWIVNTGMHGVMEAKKSEAFKQMLKRCNLWTPDGISLVWLARLNGFKLKRRVAGPDLFHQFLMHSNAKGYKHYFYGDTGETLEALKKKLSEKTPNIKMEAFSPPFRKLSAEEDAQVLRNINEAKPDVLWVGLGLPKQETWIFEHKDRLQVPVIVGVGAAFKFEAGTVKRAPAWMGNMGFEWLWRLFQEPKRVWRRVFVDAPQFVFLTTGEFIKNLITKKNVQR